MLSSEILGPDPVQVVLEILLGLLELDIKIILLLRWHCSPMRTFASLMDFTQSYHFDLSFQFVILHLLVSIFTQFHHLFIFWSSS